MLCKTNAGGGGSASAWAYIGVTYPSGSVCTATNGTVAFTAQGTSGQYVFHVPEPLSTPETWTVSCTDGSRTKSVAVSIETQYQNVVVTLSYSRLPEGYQEVEYLEQATGSEYVQFPSLTSSDNRGQFEYAWEPVSYSTANTYSIFGASGCGNATSGMQGAFYQTYSYANTSTSSLISSGGKRSVVVNQTETRNLIENNTVLETFSGTPSTGLRMYYGAFYSSGIKTNTSPIRLFEFKRTNNNGDLILDAVPCKTTGNVIGFYDLVSGTMYTNSGSGTFVVGPDV